MLPGGCTLERLPVAVTAPAGPHIELRLPFLALFVARGGGEKLLSRRRGGADEGTEAPPAKGGLGIPPRCRGGAEGGTEAPPRPYSERWAVMYMAPDFVVSR